MVLANSSFILQLMFSQGLTSSSQVGTGSRRQSVGSCATIHPIPESKTVKGPHHPHSPDLNIQDSRIKTVETGKLALPELIIKGKRRLNRKHDASLPETRIKGRPARVITKMLHSARKASNYISNLLQCIR